MTSPLALAILIVVNLMLLALGWWRYRAALAKVAEAHAAERRAQSLSERDPLTGILNRASMNKAVTQLIEDADWSERKAAMLVVDIDGFKTVNELNGHLTGDSLLRTVADVVRDAVPAGSAVARIGADSFAAAFMIETAEREMVTTIADALVQRLASPFDLAGVHARITASIGIACTEQPGENADTLTRRADIAMLTAKRGGQGRFAWFDASMQRELSQRNEIEAGLRAGIGRGEVIPYFEPQVCLSTGALRGFEMLARWQRPGRGVVQPSDFIPVAEEAGLIGELSLSVMRQAMAEARGWDNSMILSVNISPIQLKDPWLAQKIAKLLSETGFPAERLEIEITESALIENLGLAQAIVLSFTNQGIRLVLDDFGTGYSSLAHLRALPFERIKIDRSFIANIDHDPECAVVVTAIARLAESFNLSITAEGIEAEAVQERLKQIGTFTGQGWLYGKPMPIVEIRTLLASQGLLPAARDVRAMKHLRAVRSA